MNPDHFSRVILEILNKPNIDKDVQNKAIVALQKVKEEEEQTKREQEQEQTKRTWLYIFHKENWVNL